MAGIEVRDALGNMLEVMGAICQAHASEDFNGQLVCRTCVTDHPCETWTMATTGLTQVAESVAC